jgi:hypothetical protein
MLTYLQYVPLWDVKKKSLPTNHHPPIHTQQRNNDQNWPSIPGSCTLENLWFEDVCEDAISIKGDGTANIIGGGAFHASDKVIQHNGCGTVNIKNFYAEDYGKVYRSCGNCSGNCARSVTMEGVTAVNGGELIGINPNLGDKASYSNNCFDTSTQCQGYVGCDKASGECEPDKAEAC